MGCAMCTSTQGRANVYIVGIGSWLETSDNPDKQALAIFQNTVEG